MSIFKRIISLLMVIVMVISMFPAQAVAAGHTTATDKTADLADILETILEQPEDNSTEPASTLEETRQTVIPEVLPETNPEIILQETEGDYSYTVSADTNTATITGYSGSDAELLIPDTLGGYPVVGIGEYAFSGKTTLLSISIPEGVTTIGYHTFYNCDSLTEVTIPASLTSTGSKVFEGCDSLVKIVLAEGSTVIPEGMYCNLTTDFEIVIPSTVTDIRQEAFSNCTGMCSIDLPEGITLIGYRAFYNCSSLSSFNYPLNWSSAGRDIFTGCSSLLEITIPEGVTAIPDNAFYGANWLLRIIIPNSVIRIGNNAFANCANLILSCDYHSYATIYAIENDIPFHPTGAFIDSEECALDRSGSSYYADIDGMAANGYVSMKVSYAIKESHQNTVENAELYIILPSSTSLNEMTLKLDGVLCTDYTYDGERILKVPVTKFSGELRFYVEMTGQNLYSYATLSVTESGKTSKEIIGILNENVNVLTINAPETIGTDTIPISGVAPASAEIALLLDGEEQFVVAASKAGNWSGEVVIDSPVNYTDYTITAQCTSDGEAVEQNVSVEYRAGDPVLTGFIMSYNEHNVIKSCDFLDTDGTKPVVYFLPGTQFDFAVEFDNPEAIDAVYVTSTRNQEKKYLEATYDEELGVFMTDGYFDEDDANYVPGKLNVEYTKKYETIKVSDEYDWSIFDEVTQYVSDETVVLEESSETDILANINLSSVNENLSDVWLKAAVSVYDNATGESLKEWLGVFESYETMAGYVIPGVDDNKYIVYFDTSDPKQYLMLVKDFSDNTFIKLALESMVDDGYDDVWDSEEAWNLIEISSTLSTVNKASGLILKQLEIETNMDKLREEVWTTPYATSEQRETALQMVDALEKDQMYFSLITTVLPMIVTAAGTTLVGATMGAPAILFTAILGFYTSMAPICWQIRTNMVKSPSYMAKFAVDPSGYVFDATTMERLEDVKVTAYCIPEDESEDFWNNIPADDEYGTLWDASEYNQENPLYTNIDGKYAWDVPTGWWRVKCEKEGYETVWSDWLPVPPPQTEVNIGMTPLDHCGKDVIWIIDDAGTLTISGTGDMADYSTEEAAPWYDIASAVTNVVIEESVTSIGSYAFDGCTNLTSIEIAATVESIGTYAFHGGEALEEITIGENITDIGNYAFSGCTSLSKITFEGTAPTIGTGAFQQVTATAYYPGDNASWTADTKQNYGGTITWIPVCSEHSYDSLTVEPTCTEQGYTTHTCTNCGDSYVDNYTDPLGHDWEGSTCTRCGAEAEVSFTDVPTNAYYYEPVIWAVEQGITNGYGSADTFAPDVTCNRGQVVTFLWRAAGEPEPSSSVNPFTDIKESDYFYKAVLWAVEEGITAGYGSDTIFNPNGSCTRGQVATFLWRFFDQPQPASTENPFTDVKSSEFYYTAVLWAAESGITAGYGNAYTFAPNMACNRGQVVTFLYRAMN